MPSNTITNTVTNVLAERGTNYGDFTDNARVAQGLKNAARSGVNWDVMPEYMREGIDMILSKISRMVTGDYSHLDNLVDIQGYAKLIEDRIRAATADFNTSIYPTYDAGALTAVAGIANGQLTGWTQGSVQGAAPIPPPMAPIVSSYGRSVGFECNDPNCPCHQTLIAPAASGTW